MKIEMRITKNFLKDIRHDLYRPHSFAYERVGFVYCRSYSKDHMLIASTYEPVADHFYIEDKMIGARFSGEAIRLAMQRSLKTKEGVFHIHVHEHRGEPELSRVDIKSVLEISCALSDICPEINHGCILLSEDQCKTYVLDNNKKKLELIKTSVIGFPFSFFYPEGEII